MRRLYRPSQPGKGALDVQRWRPGRGFVVGLLEEPAEAVVAAVAPTLQRYLTADLD